VSDRYAVQERLPEVGPAGQQRLGRVRITVVGAGGLGCAVLQQLAGLGIGTIRIIDGDTVALGNLQRQLLYREGHVGRYKAEVAREELQSRNSTITVEATVERLTEANAADLLAGSDVVIDCTDNLPARLATDAYCADRDCPLVYGGVRGFTGQVSVFNYRGGASFRSTFPDLREGLTCLDSGVLAPVVTVTGSLQVSEAVKIVLGREGVLQGELVAFDLLGPTFRRYRLKNSRTQCS
jgi:adenylyltransferase/sulfurtransferase